MLKAKTPDVTYATIAIDEKEAEALLAVLSRLLISVNNTVPIVT
jgi:hypothetical protein